MRTPRTTWLLLVVIFALFYSSNANLNLYISKEFANNELEWNFESDLYIIRDGEPAALLKNPKAFAKFMAPLPRSLRRVKFQWSSSPQMSHYSMQFESSDVEAVPIPACSLPLQGIVPQSIRDLVVSFDCTGNVGGAVELSFLLNYTKIQGASVKPDTTKSFKLIVNKLCEKKGEPSKPSSQLSRSLVVGLCAGVTLLACLIVGVVLICRHMLKQRKLKIEFEDDLESEDKGKGKVFRKPTGKEPDESLPTCAPIYSPPRQKSQGSARRSRYNVTNNSDSSLTELIVENDEELQVVLSPPECKAQSIICTKLPKSCTFPRESVGSGVNSNFTWNHPENSPSYYETEVLLEHKSAIDGPASAENVFSLLNEAWATELAEVLIHRGQVDLLEPIKRGTFGCVYKGRVRGLDRGNPRLRQEVYVKVLQDEANIETVKSFVHEAIIMKDLLHPNVSPLLGVALQRTAPPYLVMPLAKRGDLGHLLKLSRATAARAQTLTSRQIINLGVQVTSGMEYIVHKHIIHRNLSAKTCVVDEDLTVKISDFSLAQLCVPSCKPDVDIKSRILRKWSAPESFIDGLFSEKTDVWSFGVVLWELVSLGKLPYQGLEENQMERQLQTGYRLAQPKNCPEQLYSMMKTCWSSVPTLRPTFSSLLKQLEDYEKKLSPGGLQFEPLLTESTC